MRGLLARTLAEIDQELGVDDEPPAGVSATNWRKSSAHPPLNDEGVAEIERRFAAGEDDNTIALAMRISLDGVARRRTVWRRKTPTA